jgi:acylphosphatase
MDGNVTILRVQASISGIVLTRPRSQEPNTDSRASYFTAKRATSLGVTGYVRNEDNGTVGPLWLAFYLLIVTQVTGEAQGDDDGLKSFLEIIKKGPPLASVTGVQTANVDLKEGEKSFVQYR